MYEGTLNEIGTSIRVKVGELGSDIKQQNGALKVMRPVGVVWGPLRSL